MKYMKTKDFEISNNNYVNYRYGISITIPTNWNFSVNNLKSDGIFNMVNFNKVQSNQLKKMGGVIIYNIYQNGNEKKMDLFKREVEDLKKSIDFDKDKIEKFNSNRVRKILLSREVIDKVIKVTNKKNSIEDWYYIEETFEEVSRKNGNVLIRRAKVYSYTYYIPYRYNYRNYYLPLAIQFGMYEDDNFSEGEYLQEQMQVIQSFRTFSNFVRDGLPSEKK
ncbi:MAG: hypothetical protein WHS77_10975 [Brevinematales bacterium]